MTRHPTAVITAASPCLPPAAPPTPGPGTRIASSASERGARNPASRQNNDDLGPVVRRMKKYPAALATSRGRPDRR
jgi:hypothetical protein